MEVLQSTITDLEACKEYNDNHTLENLFKFVEDVRRDVLTLALWAKQVTAEAAERDKVLERLQFADGELGSRLYDLKNSLEDQLDHLKEVLNEHIPAKPF